MKNRKGVGIDLDQPFMALKLVGLFFDVAGDFIITPQTGTRGVRAALKNH